MSTERSLEIKELSKRYGATVALQNLSFDVHAGEVFGFVGRNGAGKTTTMRIVLGVLAADAGEVRWTGVPLDFAARRRIGYMPEERCGSARHLLQPRARACRGLCDRVGIIDRGRMVAIGTVAELRSGGRERLWIDAPGAAAGWQPGVPGVRLVQADGTRRLFELDPGVDDQALLQAALSTGPVREFERVEPTLGEIFRTVIEESAA